ncbi:factor-independent urate hydroxylase [Oceanobacillus massiliensis]|uniref:factor-independent urate hydroxylase n=1 Tax=Oceanobacillus massiliensis TaxID=1465765 RepID=UPI003016E9AA
MINHTNERAMFYGKKDVFAYRTYLKPLSGIRKIPESDFAGRNNIIFGINVSVSVGGEELLPSFAEGDNSKVVATDSMKNFIQRHLGSYDGSTIEGFVSYVSKSFLERYPHFESIQMTGREVPFKSVKAITEQGLKESPLVFDHSRNECAEASVAMKRYGETIEMRDQKSGITGLQLIKVKGNSFVGFVRDEYTTLPEDGNRPLFIYLNIYWRYADAEQAYGEDPNLYAAAEQIKDIAASVFHELETASIQHLIYKIGCRILHRFPQLKDITFESQNRTWETVVEDIEGSEGKVYTEPRPPYGFQVFTVTQEDALQDIDSLEEQISK